MSKFTKKYSWVLFMLFFVGALIDVRFGLAALACMVGPSLYGFITGKNKFCTGYCPRGSFLQKFLPILSRKSPIPKSVRGFWGKVFVLSFMATSIGISLYISIISYESIGTTLIRAIMLSSLFALVLGVMYQPRAWCTVCPGGVVSRKLNNHAIPKKISLYRKVG